MITLPYRLRAGVLGFWFHIVCVPPSALSCICSLCHTEGGFSMPVPLPHFCPSLVGVCFLMFWKWGCSVVFGPTSVFGRLYISGLRGFTAPSHPSYGTLCFVSVEGFVRERAFCIFPSLEDRALIVLLADPRVGNFS